MEAKKVLNISSAIKQRRIKANLSQKQLAEMIGTTKQLIQQAEKGKAGISIKTLINICSALDCTPNDILGFAVSEKET